MISEGPRAGKMIETDDVSGSRAVETAGPGRGEKKAADEEVEVQQKQQEGREEEKGREEESGMVSPRAGSWYPLNSPVEALSKLKLTEVVEEEKRKEKARRRKRKRISNRLAKSRF